MWLQINTNITRFNEVIKWIIVDNDTNTADLYVSKTETSLRKVCKICNYPDFLVVGIRGQNFFMYVDGKKHYYEFSATKVLVKANMLNATDIKNIMLANKINTVKSIISLNEGLFLINTMNEINRWNTMENVSYSSEILIV